MLIRIRKPGECPPRRIRAGGGHARRGLRLGVLLAGLGALWALPTQAATCGMDAPTVARADVAFVGTLTSASATGDRATFAVGEVWGAASLPAVVEVVGLPGRWSMPPPGTSELRYLVVAEVVAGGLRDTGDCGGPHPSLSVIWDPSLADFRPPTAHPPTAVVNDAGLPPQLYVAAGLVLLLGLVSAIAFRRSRPRAGE